MRIRLTARLQLTLLLSGLFLATGAILLGLNYVLVRYRLETGPMLVPAPMLAPALVTSQSPDAPQTSSVPLDPGQVPLEPLPEIADLQRQFVAVSLRELVIQSSIALAAMSLVVVGLSWMVAGRVLRPIQKITAVARQLSEQSLHKRIALQGPHDELKELADTFDIMLERLAHAFDHQRRFAANASHELRTPLTIMRTEIDVTLTDAQATEADLRAMAETVRAAIDRSERLIESLLILGRSQQIVERSRWVDLADVAALSLAQVDAVARTLQLKLESALAPAPLVGEHVLVERLGANLIENAVRYNLPGGWVQVSTRIDAEHACLQVANSGPIVPPDEVEELFVPFRRMATARTRSQHGSGLGLSIVRAIASAHGGTVSAQAREGGGLIVTVKLPSAASDHSLDSSQRPSPMLSSSKEQQV